MYRGHKEVLAVGLDHDCIYRLKSIVREFNIVTDHDDGKLRFHSLDFRGDNSAVQQTEVELDHDCVDLLRHQQAQTFMPAGCGNYPVSLLLQMQQLVGITVYAE